MAILEGPLRLRGSLGNLSTFTNKNGKRIVRGKGGASRNKMLSDPRMERSRENFRDFSNVSILAGKVRKAFAPYSVYTSDNTYFNRLMGLLKMVQKTDLDNDRGVKETMSGNIHLLEDFEWNANLPFSEALDVNYDSFVDAAAGRLQLEFASFVPLAAVKAPAGATHFQLIAKGAAVHLGEKRPALAQTASKLFPLNSVETGSIHLSMDVVPGDMEGRGILMLGAGIIFYELEMDIPFAMRGGAFTMVSVERVNNKEEVPDIDIQTSEVLENNPAAAGKAARKSRRAAALEYMADRGYSTLLTRNKGMTPIGFDPEEKAKLDEKLRIMERKLWRAKLDKYRKG